MSRFEFRLAAPDDDEALRTLLSSCPMDGGFAVALLREPSYFAAAEIDGSPLHIVTVYDRDAQRLVGMGSRAIQQRYVNGAACNIGYLSGLRLLPEYQGHAGILARGYRMFRELHEDGLAPYYVTTIAASNTKAIDLLTSGRAPLPTYYGAGLFLTIALPPSAKAQSRNPVAVRTAAVDDAIDVVAFLAAHASQREFFPVYSVEDLLGDRGLLRDLSMDSVLLAERDGDLAGTLALWDQRNFKQSVIVSYPWWLGHVRPLYNAVARVRAATRLPPPGEPINSRFAALFAVANDDLEVAAALVEESQRLLYRQGGDAILFGLHEQDPLMPVFEPLQGHRYLTRLFLVHWENQEPDYSAIRRNAPYLELARL